ncbi:hypothetical protein [Mycolicibacterium peregrinum]|uniref:hypothetical protein n=1 Tax=Mycolicibacterium peregrinum TaxID=43304 RepID=UPI003AAE3048
MSVEFEFPVQVVDATLQSVTADGPYWVVSGSAQGQQWWGEFPRELMSTAPREGVRYRFELTIQTAYGEPQVVAVTTPDGVRSGLSAEQILQRQIEAKIEQALSDMSTIGWAAGYLTDASGDAWDLVISGPGRAGQTALWNRGSAEEMGEALRTVLRTAARRGWWPKEIYLREVGRPNGYSKVPLAQQHYLRPVPGLRAGAEDHEVYQGLAALWDLPAAQSGDTTRSNDDNGNGGGGDHG